MVLKEGCWEVFLLSLTEILLWEFGPERKYLKQQSCLAMKTHKYMLWQVLMERVFATP